MTCDMESHFAFPPNQPTVTMEESQPLLRSISEPREPTVNEPRVDFNPSGDPENPLEWPNAYKMIVVSLLALMAFTV